MTTTEKELGPRPYSRLRDQPPSVTTILNEMSKDGLQWGSAKEAALFAVFEQDQWRHLEDKDAVDLIRKHFRGVWDNRAMVGTVTHSVMESWIHGDTIDVEVLCRNVPTWENVLAERITEVMLYVDGLEQFWLDWQPTDIKAEEIVREPGQYIGTRDIVATLKDGQRWLLDTKTTGEKNPEKGIYVDSWSAQLAPYRFASEIVTFARNAKGRPEVVSVKPNEPVDCCGVIHLRGDGRYELIPIEAGPAELDIFNALRDIYLWRKGLKTPRPMEAP